MKYKFKISNIINQVLISFSFVFLVLIINKFSPNFILNIKKQIFNKSFNFVKVNKISKDIIGREVFSYNDNKTLNVISDNNLSNYSTKYYDGEEFIVSDSLPIGAIQSGVVIYIGEKEHYNNTVIVQGVDGFNIWYGNLKDISVSLYDYVEKHSLVGSADKDRIYMLIEKNNKLYTYDEYKNYQN